MEALVQSMCLEARSCVCCSCIHFGDEVLVVAVRLMAEKTTEWGEPTLLCNAFVHHTCIHAFTLLRSWVCLRPVWPRDCLRPVCCSITPFML